MKKIGIQKQIAWIAAVTLAALTLLGSCGGGGSGAAEAGDAATSAEIPETETPTAASSGEEGADRFAGVVDETNKARYTLNSLGYISDVEIAIEKGFFAEEGVEVEVIGVAGGGAMTVQEITAGNADIGSAPYPPVINSHSTGGDVITFLGSGSGYSKDGYEGDYWVVRSDGEIKGPEDLKGKTIAMGALGAMWEYGTREYLARAGLTKDDVNIILVPPTQHEQVLKSKQVDLTVTSSPIADKIIEDGTAEFLTSTYRIYTDDGSEYPQTGGYVTSPEYASKNPHTLQGIIAALIKTNEWVNANPDEAREIVATVLEGREQDPALAEYWKPASIDDYGLLSDDGAEYWIAWFVGDGVLEEGQVQPSDIYTNIYNPYYEGE
ncbi:MAG: ABC transporter substrate-binding protein [Clostridiales Family XIII bacterium]|jgi:ABC-type nitrate/sulfonate/bicarbonate transport system substrate-binding protein|nr:ABC transporter substrate-binding protein [Clostridiales Family XIII bacterium]